MELAIKIMLPDRSLRLLNLNQHDILKWICI